jgi:hypothetical protein
LIFINTIIGGNIMFKKVLVILIGCVVVAGSAFAYTDAEIDAAAEKAGKVNSIKCIVLAKGTITAYKSGISQSEAAFKQWRKSWLKEMAEMHEKLDDGTIIEYTKADIDKTDEILTQAYNACVTDVTTHGWKPLLFNRTLDTMPKEIGAECIMQNLYE